MTFSQILRFMEDYGKSKFEKGTGWRGDASDIEIREIPSKNLTIDSK